MNNASVVSILSSQTLQIKESSCAIVCEFWKVKKKRKRKCLAAMIMLMMIKFYSKV